MKYWLLLFILLSNIHFSNAQEKVKGNRTVIAKTVCGEPHLSLNGAISPVRIFLSENQSKPVPVFFLVTAECRVKSRLRRTNEHGANFE